MQNKCVGNIFAVATVRFGVVHHRITVHRRFEQAAQSMANSFVVISVNLAQQNFYSPRFVIVSALGARVKRKWINCIRADNFLVTRWTN